MEDDESVDASDEAERRCPDVEAFGEADRCVVEADNLGGWAVKTPSAGTVVSGGLTRRCKSECWWLISFFFPLSLKRDVGDVAEAGDLGFEDLGFEGLAFEREDG